MLDSSYTTKERAIIDTAFRHIEEVSCIRFRRRWKQKSYIKIFPPPGLSGGAWATMGKKWGEQIVALPKDMVYKNIIVHELMHSLGFTHEHQRPDRDQYVEVHFDRITDHGKKSFKKNSAAKVDTLGTPYDYCSIMHYQFWSFAKVKILFISNAYAK